MHGLKCLASSSIDPLDAIANVSVDVFLGEIGRR